jgi:hypothetical protein
MTTIPCPTETAPPAPPTTAIATDVVARACTALLGQCVSTECNAADEGNRYHQVPERSIDLGIPHLKPFMRFHLAQLGDTAPYATPYIAWEADGSWPGLNYEQTGQLIDAADAWLADLRRDHAQLGILTSHRDTDAEPAEGRTWTLTIEGGGSITHHLPAWAENDPSQTVAPDDLSRILADVGCWRYFEGSAEVPVSVPGEPGEGPKVIDLPLLSAAMNVHPYRPDRRQRKPTVSLELLEDVAWIEDLDPDGLADVIGKLRAQCDRLEHVHAQLVAARADWEENAR